MRVFIAYIFFKVKDLVQYRATFMLSLIGEPIVLWVCAAFYSKVYAYNQTDVLVGYNLSQMIWYFAGVTLVWYCIWNNTDNSIANKILSGDLSIDLLKPISVFQLELAGAIGARILGFFFEFVPSFVIFCLIAFPSFLTVFSLLKFLMAASLSFLIFFHINYIIGLAAFRIRSNYSLQSLKFVIISLMAGEFIPLEFYPDWFNHVIAYLPFQYIFYWPIQILLNRVLSGARNPFLKIIIIQMFWVATLYFLSKFYWKRAVRKYCGVGG